jgi:hypothetical protein
MKLVFLILITLSANAMAACLNLIDLSDAQKMVQALPLNKPFLKCDEPKCICIDGSGADWWIEDASIQQQADGSYIFAVDQVKAKARADAKVAAKQKMADAKAALPAKAQAMKDAKTTADKVQALIDYQQTKADSEGQ